MLKGFIASHTVIILKRRNAAIITQLKNQNDQTDALKWP